MELFFGSNEKNTRDTLNMSEMGNPACAMPTHWVVVRRPAVALE
jgi:hypothetical protein